MTCKGRAAPLSMVIKYDDGRGFPFVLLECGHVFMQNWELGSMQPCSSCLPVCNCASKRKCA